MAEWDLWELGVEKVISGLFSIERRPQLNPQNHSPQGYYEVDSTQGMNLIVEQTFVDHDCGILIVQVKASEYLNYSFIFNILTKENKLAHVETDICGLKHTFTHFLLG